MKKIIFIVFFIFLSLSCFADVVALKGRVNDYTDTLNNAQKEELNNLLADCERKTSSQVVLFIIKSLNGDTIEGYSMKLAEKYKFGQKKFDNGVILLVALNDRKLRIEVGYGLESILTDLKCNYIINKLIVPFFKKGDYPGGIKKGLETIVAIVNKDFDISPEELKKYKNDSDEGGSWVGLIFFLLCMIFVGVVPGGSGGGGGFSSGGGFSGGGGSFGGGGASGGW